MKRDIKSEILTTARKLFNELGYNQVSMRTIADALSISVGNLTYHYKKKEDLAEAVVFEQSKGHQQFVPSQTLSELQCFFHKILLHQSENAYYFRHYVQLASQSLRIYEKQQWVIGEIQQSLEKSFQSLKTTGILKEDELPNQSNSLIQAIMTICLYGSNFKDAERLGCIWSLIFPLLTKKGREAYYTIFSHSY